jgi:hypothetical protein
VSGERETRLDPSLAGYLRRTMTPAQVHDELFTVWSAARAEANLAYAAWCDAPGSNAYVVYRAAEDRADAAEQALASALRPLLAAA